MSGGGARRGHRVAAAWPQKRMHERSRSMRATYRVRYEHRNTGKVARFYPMSRADALEVARQLLFDGETGVVIEDENGDTFSVEAFSARGR